MRIVELFGEKWIECDQFLQNRITNEIIESKSLIKLSSISGIESAGHDEQVGETCNIFSGNYQYNVAYSYEEVYNFLKK